jgi:hypothetical protein
VEVDARIARRRRLLVAAGVAPLALTLVAWAAFSLLVNDEGAAGAVYVLVLSLPVALGMYATAPLVAAVRARRARAGELDAVAPLVWCTLAAAVVGVGIIAAAFVTSDLAVQTLWPGIVVQTLGWVAGDRLGRRRARLLQERGDREHHQAGHRQ